MSGLADRPRVRLATTPTPLHPAPGLSAELGTEVWFKRDDLTGFGLGGNKVRILEYLLGDATARACDCLVTGAGPQSNWAMLAALAARTRGLDTHLVFYGERVAAAGNMALAELAGAEITFTGDEDRASVDAGIAEVAGELRRAGRRPYVLPRGGAIAEGSLGYARACLELAEQLRSAGLRPRALWLATGSCGTQAGLLAGAGWLGLSVEVVGVTVSRPVDECLCRVGAIAGEVAALLGAGGGPPAPRVLGGFAGPGYGQRSTDGEAAAGLVARREGVFLDPVFGAKAMAALLATAPEGPVIFLVSGGAPTLFTARGPS
jgi:D-cysteine desulfhydrase